MQNRRTTAQINAKTLSRLKEVAKARNQPLYVLLDEAVIDYLKNPIHQKETKLINENQRQKTNLYRYLVDIKPFTGKNKWLTTGIGAFGWLIYTLLPD
jgi:hypothetical protein